MWRLTMSDGAALLSPELDASGRSAAIAAMAARLAAARPRMRRRVDAPAPRTDDPAGAVAAREPAPPEPSEPPPAFPRERLATVSARPPGPWRQHLGTVRNGALLAAMAGSGFGAVVLAQSHSVAAFFNGGSQARPAAAALPDPAPQPATQAASQPAPPRRASHKVPEEAGGARAAAAVFHKTQHDRLMAKAFSEPAHIAPRPAAMRTATLTASQAAARQPAQHAQTATFALPRWVTEPPATPALAAAPPAAPPQPVTMSPPPHDLALPPAAPAGPSGSATVKPPPPKPQAPDMVFASSGTMQPSPYGGAPARPAFEPPSWPRYGGGFGYGPP